MSRGGSRPGFTLIELLIATTIIALLASLLLPAIQMVRSSAQSTACASNLRQFGFASLSYVRDNGGRWPTGMWQQLLQDYLNQDGQMGNLATAARFRLGRCPTVPARTSAGVDLNASYSYSGVYFPSWNYGAPLYFGWQLVSNPPVIRDGRIVRREEKCVLSEYWDNTNAAVGQASWGKSQLSCGAVARVHRTGSNFLLADGRVQFAKLPNFRLFVPSALTDNLWYPYVNTPSAVLR